MHPDYLPAFPRLRLLPPWVFLHFAHASKTVPADVRNQFVLAGCELEQEAELRHDPMALDLFLDTTCLSPNVRSLISSLVVDVDSQLGDDSAPALRAALRPALDQWNSLTPGALATPPNHGIYLDDPLVLFAVDEASQKATPRVTAALPTPLPEQAFAELRRLAQPVLAALGLQITVDACNPASTAVHLTNGLDASNDAAIAFGAVPRFVPAGDILGLPSAVAPATVKAYRETVFRVEGAVRTELRVGTNHLPLHTFFALYGSQSCAFVTAVNPRSHALDAAENRQRHAALRAELELRRCKHFEGTGAHPSNGWPPEAGFLVFGLGLDEARGLGRRFDQDAIVWAGIDTRVRLALLR
jgi:hypothetical protein